jgi:Super-infection exclusion protein B
MTDFSKILDWIKLQPRHLAGAVVASGAYLLLGSKQLAFLGLSSVDAELRPWVAGLLLVSAGFLSAHGVASCFAAAQKAWNSRRLLRFRQTSLHHLSPEERAVLAAYVLQNTKSLQLQITSGVAGGLEAAGIIYRSSSVGRMGSGFAYNIQPWAWEYLREHPELLALDEAERGGRGA